MRALANDTEFGLVSDVSAGSLRHAAHCKRYAEAGMVLINLPTAGVTAGVNCYVPFGGRKGSSYGTREQGRHAADFYPAIKTAYTQA